MNAQDMLIQDSIFKIGKVISVNGRSVSIAVDKAKNSSHLLFKGQLVKNVSVGSYVKIIKGFTKIICKVEGESILEDKGYAAKKFSNEKDRVSRILNVSLLGFFKGMDFKLGIREMPLIENECYLLSKDEFDSVHYFVKKNDKPILIGNLSLEREQEIRFGIDSLFASHIGIFGNTGSGKSYTLAKLYYELFKEYKNKPEFQTKAKFVVIDFNGEYVNDDDNVIVEKEYKDIYKLSNNDIDHKYPLSLNVLEDTSFLRIILDATEKTQTPFLKRAIGNEWILSRVAFSESLKGLIASDIVHLLDKKDKDLGVKVLLDFLSDLDNNIPESNIYEVSEYLRAHLIWYNENNKFAWVVGPRNWKFDQEMNELVRDAISRISFTNWTPSVMLLLKLRIIFQYHEEVIRGHSNREHLSPLIKRMEKRFDELDKLITVEVRPSIRKNISIISLKDVSLEMRKVLPLLLCKEIYEDQKRNSDSTTYLNIIIDEAHNILSEDSNREMESWKDYRLETFEEIIKEGRKFGVFVTIASQRPSDISPTIISQIHNFFVHRLINNRDIAAIEKSISYLDKTSFDYIPILPVGSCIIAGLASQVPVIVDVGMIESRYEPNNKTRSLVEFWG
jgi:DNA helicase HerA-like ATPase